MPDIEELNQVWIPVKDGDERAVAIYRRHYSAITHNHGALKDLVRYGFSGQGESLILLTQDCKSLFGWRKQKINDAGQEGIECFVFRREGGDIIASELIKEAMKLAFNKWGNNRLFTYIDPQKVRHKRDYGRCFIRAGWKPAGTSKKGKLILEYLKGELCQI